MQLKNRLYPYPVLSIHNNDFNEGYFNVDVTYINNKKTLDLTFFVELNEELLKEYIDDRIASYGVHIECPTTSFREFFKFNEEKKSVSIPIGKIDKKVEICTFIVSNANISSYSTTNFNEIYSGMEFPIDPHNILAVGKEKNIRIEKDFDSLKNVASVFKMIPDFDKNNEYISRDFYGDIVSINVPKAQFDAYKMAVTNKKNIPMMHSMFIFPVLLEIFQTLLNNDDWEIYEDLRGFKAIKIRMNFTLLIS
jgi:hypothetical protein